jgi:hypothetical protein
MHIWCTYRDRDRARVGAWHFEHFRWAPSLSLSGVHWAGFVQYTVSLWFEAGIWVNEGAAHAVRRQPSVHTNYGNTQNCFTVGSGH